MSHTDGPWVAIEGDTFNPDRPWGVSKYLTLAECQEIDGDEATYPSRTTVIAEVMCGPTAEADAKLMAAAPDLLAACKALLQYENLFDRPRHGSPKAAGYWQEATDLANAAIEKATRS